VNMAWFHQLCMNELELAELRDMCFLHKLSMEADPFSTDAKGRRADGRAWSSKDCALRWVARKDVCKVRPASIRFLVPFSPFDRSSFFLLLFLV
jgi:hypothetical protein